MSKRDYYEILGVARDAADTDIKKAYRRVAMKFHPDRNPGDKDSEDRFKEANMAYEVLSDPQKRSAYDQFGHAAVDGSQGGGQGGFGAGGANFSDIFGDVFGDIFGGARGGRVARGRAPQRLGVRRPAPDRRRAGADPVRRPAAGLAQAAAASTRSNQRLMSATSSGHTRWPMG